jgi:AcrR family transcriptional regulator
MQGRSQETREQLLTSAEKCFSQSGYDGTGVAEICADAQVSKGAFYHHFPSKHAVFMSLLKNWLKQLDHQLFSLTDLQESVPDSLTRMGGMLGFVFQSASGRLPLFLEFWAQASRDKEVWQATIAPYRRYQQQFTRLVQRGIDEGTLKTADPQATAWVIMALVTGVILQGLLDPKAANWDKVGRHGLQVILEGLKKK